MELFLIYLVTRLTDFKEAIDSVADVAGVMLVLTIVVRVLNEFITEPQDREKAKALETDKANEVPASDGNYESSLFFYLGIRRTTKRGLWMFTPVFLVCFVVNLLLPTTRDAVVIAGGYGVVEAVQNEKFQQLFAKSAKVATQWLEVQLNGEAADAPTTDKAEAPKGK